MRKETADSSWRTGATSSRKKLDIRLVESLGTRTIAGLQEAHHPAVGGKLKEEVHKAPGRENGKLKAMKGLPSWNQKLEESYQAKEMEYGSAGS